MPLLASINFGIYLVLSPSHAYNTFLLASIYFGEIISCTKFAKINGKPIFQALQYLEVWWSYLPRVSCYMQKYLPFIMDYGSALLFFACKLHYLQTFEHMIALWAVKSYVFVKFHIHIY